MALLTVAALGQLASAQGTLKGRMVYDGKAPTPKAIRGVGVGFCGPFVLKDEELVVNPKNGGVKNVAVFLYVSRTDKNPPITAAARKRAAQVRIDALKCRYEPRLIAMTVDQVLIIANKDAVAHNFKIDVINDLNISINPIIPANKNYKHTFAKEERLPIPISCGIHPWMQGYLMIRETPYFAVTDENGNFEIKDLPSGEWTFRFWQERTGYVDKVKHNGTATTWKRGGKRVKIVAGQTVDLGDVLSKFEE